MRQRSARSANRLRTIILHWTLAAAFAIAVVTGLRSRLRLRTETGSLFWIRCARGTRVSLHMQGRWCWSRQLLHMPSMCGARACRLASGWIAIRVAGLLAEATRAGAVNVILIGCSSSRCSPRSVTGGLLYFDYAHRAMVDLHWFRHVGAAGRCRGGTCRPLETRRGRPASSNVQAGAHSAGAVPLRLAELFALLADAQVQRAGPKQGSHRPRR